MNGLGLRRGALSKGVAPASNPPIRFSDALQQRFGKCADSLINSANLNAQIEHIKNLSKEIINGDLTSTLLLINVFLEAPINHPIKKNCARVFKSSKNNAALIDRIYDELSAIISRTNVDDEESINNSVDTVAGCLEVFPEIENNLKILTEVLGLLKRSLKVYLNVIKYRIESLSPTKKMEIYSYIHNSNRTLLPIVQKNYQINFMGKSELTDMTDISVELLNHEMPVNNIGSCCRILLYLVDSLHGKNSWIYLLRYIFDADIADLKFDIEFTKSLTNKINLCTEIINTIDYEDLCRVSIDDTSAFNFVTGHLILLSDVSSTDSILILTLTRGLLMVSKLLFEVDNDVGNSAAVLLIKFVWCYLDYYVDSVRHLTAQILTNIVRFSHQNYKKGDLYLTDKLIKNAMIGTLQQNHKALSAIGSQYNFSFLSKNNPDLVQSILGSICNSNDVLNTISLFEVLMLKHYEEASIDEIFTTWIKPVLETIATCESNDDDESSHILTAYREILLKAVKLDSGIVELMIPFLLDDDLRPMTCGQLKCMLICLIVAKKTGFFDSVDSDESQWKNMVAYDLLKSAVLHQTVELRLLSYELIVDAHKTTEYFHAKELELIETFMTYNVNVNIPSFRQKMLAISKRLFNRWQAGHAKIIKRMSDLSKNPELSKSKEMYELKQTIRWYETFLNNLFRRCIDNIYPGANLSRRSISMQLILWCLDVHSFDSVPDKDVQSLFTYLGDSYEYNKQLALKILINIPTKHELFNDFDVWRSAYLKSIQNASNVRPTDCITSAYELELLLARHPNEARFANFPYALQYRTICDLMNLLKREIHVARINILEAALNGPIYGLVFCLRHILERVDFQSISASDHWMQLIVQLIQTCFEINEVACPIVNNSSPEGHLPMDFNCGSQHVGNNGVKLDSGKIVTAQMVLLCGWRSVKEVSLLLGDISSKITVDESSERVAIDKKYIFEIGDHFITLLSETKHRGAFEQVYVGFSKLCNRLWKSESKELHNLPVVWLNDLIEAISSGRSSKLCATRRSAGVPFIIQALVTTELQVSSNPQSFQNCMSVLLNLASYETKSSVETRTHCLNILRALYRHTSLGKQVNPYVAKGLMISINGFDGDSWAERNSSTLLFSSLMTRIFGVQRTKDSERLSIRNKMTGRIFFLRYPELYDFFLDLLKNANVKDDNYLFKPSLYPVLLLLSRLYPSSLEGIDSNLQLVTFIPYLLSCSGSSILKIRELASKAVIPLISPDKFYSHLIILLKLLELKLQHNFRHGILLQIVRFLQNTTYSFTADELRSILTHVKSSSWILFDADDNPCFITIGAYLKMLYLLLTQYNFTEIDTEFFVRIQTHLIEMNGSITFGREQFYVQSLHLKFLINLMLKEDAAKNISSLIVDNIDSANREVLSVLLNYLMCIYNADNIDGLSERFELGPEKDFVRSAPIDGIIDELNTHKFKRQFLKILSSDDFKFKEKAYAIYLSQSYPSFEEFEGVSNDRIVEDIVRRYNEENYEISYVYVKTIDAFLKNHSFSNVYEILSDESVGKLICFLFENSASDNELNREAVVGFYSNHWRIFDWKNADLSKYYHAIIQWQTIFNLSNDDYEIVSHRTTDFMNDMLKTYNDDLKFTVNENKAKELLLEMLSDWISAISSDHAVVMLILIALGIIKSSDDLPEYQVFEKDEIDDSREEYAFTLLCAKQIERITGNRDKIVDLIQLFVKSDVLTKNITNGFKIDHISEFIHRLKCNDLEDCHNNKIRTIIGAIHKSDV